LVGWDYYPEIRNRDRRQEHQMREAGLRPVGVGSALGGARKGLGLFLVRAGRRLQGMSGGDLGTRPGLKADSVTR
jgi:hypothetical protein